MGLLFNRYDLFGAGSDTHRDMMTSATVSGGDDDGNGAEQVPEFDGTLFTFEVEDDFDGRHFC